MGMLLQRESLPKGSSHLPVGCGSVSISAHEDLPVPHPIFRGEKLLTDVFDEARHR